MAIKGFVVEDWKPQRTTTGNRKKGHTQMKKFFAIAGATAMAVSAVSTADITACVYTGSQVSAGDFAGQPDFNGYVIDLWLVSDDETNTVLNTFNVNISNSLGASSYYQSFTGTGWTPNNLGAPFETEALRRADSFVSMGARTVDGSESLDGGVVQMSANGTGLDPAFGGPNAGAPGENAGWYNSNPPVSIGLPIQGIVPGVGVVFVGRFSIQGAEDFDLSGTVSTTWNNGIGTDGAQAFDLQISELVVPAPGAMALLGLAGIAGGRRRRG
jgi:hypothetical protein